MANRLSEPEAVVAQTFTLGGRTFGPHSTLVVAELSANHRGELPQALALVRAAAEAGADAVKLQTYTPDTITLDIDRPEFEVHSGTVWDGRTLYDLYREAYTPWEWHAPLAAEAMRLGLLWFSSPFDRTAVDFLEDLKVPAYKIASPELVDIGLIDRVARTGKPLVISTGMATLSEIDEAVAAARAAGASQIAILKCTSAYPAPASELNLRTLPELARRFSLPVGLSDHSLSPTVPAIAVALGAVIVEKHLTLSRSEGGPDSGFSLEPGEFADMVSAIRTAEEALGQVSFEPTVSEAATRALRRSLFVVADIDAGELFTDDNIRSIRPGAGLHTRHLPEILGRRAIRSIRRGTPLSWDLIDEPER